MKTHDHAAQLAEALFMALTVVDAQAQAAMLTTSDEYAPFVRASGREALAAWKAHNAMPPQQPALDL